MKKIITLLAALMTVRPSAVYASGEQTFSETIDGSTFSYTVGDDMNATITDFSSDMTDIIIPSSLGGYMVTAIGEKAFFGKISLTSVTIPEGITYISDNAFSGCLFLEDVELPETLTYMGKECFTSCTALRNVKLSSSLSSLPERCFSSCTSLAEIDIPDSVVFIGAEAFFGCEDISGIFVPPTVEIIGDNAFGMHYNIRSNGIEKINNFRIRVLPESSAETYAINNGIEICNKLGDVNSDGFIDAVDASMVLIEYAELSIGGTSLFDQYQNFVGDYNGDSMINADDATFILIEYARLQTLPDT